MRFCCRYWLEVLHSRQFEKEASTVMLLLSSPAMALVIVMCVGSHRLPAFASKLVQLVMTCCYSLRAFRGVLVVLASAGQMFLQAAKHILVDHVLLTRPDGEQNSFSMTQLHRERLHGCCPDPMLG